MSKQAALLNYIITKITKSYHGDKTLKHKAIGTRSASRQHKHSIPALIRLLHTIQDHTGNIITLADTVQSINNMLKANTDIEKFTVKDYFTHKGIDYDEFMDGALGQLSLDYLQGKFSDQNNRAIISYRSQNYDLSGDNKRFLYLVRRMKSKAAVNHLIDDVIAYALDKLPIPKNLAASLSNSNIFATSEHAHDDGAAREDIIAGDEHSDSEFLSERDPLTKAVL